MQHRVDSLDGLRAASILLVLACHMLPLGPKSLALNETAGAMGMSLFFALSGFLITQNLLNGQSVPTFFLRRAARILPLAYLYILIAFLLLQADVQTLIRNLLFTENYNYDWLANNHFWSLCVEIHFYIAAGLILLCFGTRGLVFMPLICLLITALRIHAGEYVGIRTHLRVDEICAGSCVALAYHRGMIGSDRASPFLIFTVVAVWAVSSWVHAGWLQYLRPYFAALLLASVISLRRCWVRDVLASRPASYIAEISYALYVIHPATIYGFMSDGSIFEKYAIKRPVSFVLTFGVAHLSTFYFERHFTDWAKRITRKERINTSSDRIQASV